MPLFKTNIANKQDSGSCDEIKRGGGGQTKHRSLNHTKQYHSSKISQLFTCIFPTYADLDSKTYKTYRNISILAIINICFLICVFTPFAVYSSDVSQFDVEQTLPTLASLFGIFLFASALLVYITSFFYRTRLLKIGAYGVSVILCIGLVYTFILTGDYGAMDHFVLQKTSFNDPDLRIQKHVYFLITFFTCGIFCIFMLRWLGSLWNIAFVAFFVVSMIDVYKILDTISVYETGSDLAKKQDYKNKSEIQKKDDNEETKELQPYEKELFSYSKTEKNIVIFVLDMFSGSHLEALFEQFPELKEPLDGFVWFDNTISTTNSTVHSIATLIGGEYYSVYNMNARKNSLEKEIIKAFGTMGDNFIKSGYDVGYFMPAVPIVFNTIQSYNHNIAIVGNLATYSDYYNNAQPFLKEIIAQQITNGKHTNTILLLSMGVFRFVPELYFRPRIYNNGSWLLQNENLSNKLTSLHYASSFYAFTHLHNLNSTKPTFKYLHSVMTHQPYNLVYENGTCMPFSPHTALAQNNKMQFPSDEIKNAHFQHYDTEACALAYLSSFLGWLKDSNIYDNTQIFVISDHSGYDSIDIAQSVLSKGHRPDALFLFKDFGVRGEIRRDSRLMANYDPASIFCENLPQGCPNVPKNIIKRYPINRKLITSIPKDWNITSHKNNEWLIEHYFEVNGNIKYEESWQDITEAVKEKRLIINNIAH